MPRAKKICGKPGCPTITASSYCRTHQAEYEAKRGTTTQRGYGATHQTERQRWVKRVALGNVACARCGHTIQPDQAWDLGHHDTNRTKYNGPEHQACNRSAGGRQAHQNVETKDDPPPF